MPRTVVYTIRICWLHLYYIVGTHIHLLLGEFKAALCPGLNVEHAIMHAVKAENILSLLECTLWMQMVLVLYLHCTVGAQIPHKRGRDELHFISAHQSCSQNS